MARFTIKVIQLSEVDKIDKNAHFMDQSTFRQLVSNIRRDGQLTSVPFVVEKQNGRYVTVSGNHRVEAAKMAGLTEIPVMYAKESDITHDEMRAIQLSHNSIVGQDDAEILKELLDEIKDTALKEYAFISKEYLEEMERVDYTVELPSNEVVPVTFMFLETSKNNLDKLLEELEDMTPKELENVTLLPKETLKRLNEVSAVVQNKYKLKAQALSICKMIELCDQVLKGGAEKDD